MPFNKYFVAPSGDAIKICHNHFKTVGAQLGPGSHLYAHLKKSQPCATLFLEGSRVCAVDVSLRINAKMNSHVTEVWPASQD